MPESKPYDFHPEAWSEFETAAAWYRDRSADADVRFLAAVFDALEDISRSPQTWPLHRLGTRRFILHRFPYAIIYRERESRLEILAVAHSHRHPEYWLARI